jgi:hypothetical protein
MLRSFELRMAQPFLASEEIQRPFFYRILGMISMKRYLVIFSFATFFIGFLLAGGGASRFRDDQRNDYRKRVEEKEPAINPREWVFETQASECFESRCGHEVEPAKVFCCEHFFHSQCLSRYAPSGESISHCPLCGARRQLSVEEAQSDPTEASMRINPLIARVKKTEVLPPATPRPGARKAAAVRRSGPARRRKSAGLLRRISKKGAFYRTLQNATLNSQSVKEVRKVAEEFQRYNASIVYFLQMTRGGAKPILIRIIEKSKPEILNEVLQQAKNLEESLWFLLHWRSTAGHSLIDYAEALGKEGMVKVLVEFGAGTE